MRESEPHQNLPNTYVDFRLRVLKPNISPCSDVGRLSIGSIRLPNAPFRRVPSREKWPSGEVKGERIPAYSSLLPLVARQALISLFEIHAWVLHGFFKDAEKSFLSKADLISIQEAMCESLGRELGRFCACLHCVRGFPNCNGLTLGFS